MRKFILFFFLTAALSSQAQPVVDGRLFPKAGKSYYRYSVEYNYWNDSLGADTGANITWYLSTLKKETTVRFIDFDSPSNLGLDCGNTSANLAEGTSGLYTCFKIDSSSYKIVHEKFNGNRSFFSDGWTLLKKTLSFRDTFHDNIVYRLGTHSQAKNWLKESHVNKYDAYGTLIFDNRTYSNVIRIKSEGIGIQYFDTLSSTDTTHWYRVRYRWYSLQEAMPLLAIVINKEIYHGDSTIDTISKPVTVFIYDTTPPSGAPPGPNQSDLKIYEYDGYIHIESRSEKKKPVKFVIYDSAGKTLLVREDKTSMNHPLMIPTQNYSPGLYLIRVDDGKGDRQTVKFIVK